jgi:hypothetical protein
MTTTYIAILLALTLALPVVCAVVLSGQISRERGE